jgi:hypothetical protein
MITNRAHLSDQDLLLAADGELSPRRQGQVQRHLQSCWTCRKRMSEIECTIARVVDSYHGILGDQPGNGSEALLQARLLESPPPGAHWLHLVSAAAIILCLSAALWLYHPSAPIVPNPALTPGEAAPVSRNEVCQATSFSNNREVPESLKQAVFTEYGLNNAPRNAYEVDFLITPALGGSASLRNLWPEPYNSRAWNAHTKDILEDRLHQMVCSGQMDLFTAQREIAANWVDAYKKYVPQ